MLHQGVGLATRFIARKPANPVILKKTPGVASSPAESEDGGEKIEPSPLFNDQWEQKLKEAGYEQVNGFIVRNKIPEFIRTRIIYLLLNNNKFVNVCLRYNIKIFDAVNTYRDEVPMQISSRRWRDGSSVWSVDIGTHIGAGRYSVSEIERMLIHEIGHRVWDGLRPDEQAGFLELFKRAPDDHKAGHGNIPVESFCNWISYVGHDFESLIPDNCVVFLRRIHSEIGLPVVTSSPLGDIDGLAGSASVPREKELGGIDFRSLPIVTQAMGNLRASLGLGTAPLETQRLSKAGTVPNLDKEWQEIERVVSAGIRPSTQRIKEYIQASCVKGDIDVDKVLNCLSEVLRQEEDICCKTDNTLRDILIVLEASRSKQELKEVFVGS